MLTFQVSKEKPVAWTKDLPTVNIAAEKPRAVAPHCNLTFVHDNTVYRMQVAERTDREKGSPQPMKILQDALKQKPGEEHDAFESRVKKTLSELSRCLGEKVKSNAVSLAHNDDREYRDETWVRSNVEKTAIPKGKDPVAYLQESRQKARDSFGEPATKSEVVKSLFKSFDDAGVKFTEAVIPAKSTKFILDEGEFATTKEKKDYMSNKLAAPDIVVEFVAPKPKSSAQK